MTEDEIRNRVDAARARMHALESGRERPTIRKLREAFAELRAAESEALPHAPAISWSGIHRSVAA